jgi:hypothetical protein
MYERVLFKPVFDIYVRAYDQLVTAGYTVNGQSLYAAMIGQTFYSRQCP